MADYSNNYGDGYRAALVGLPLIDGASMEFEGGYKAGQLVRKRMAEGDFEYMEKDDLE